MKDDFVSTLSHELRTPLNAILGWIGVLKQQQSPETLAKAIDVIDRNSRRQSQMVDDLLDVSRIMSGKMRLDVHASTSRRRSRKRWPRRSRLPTRKACGS